MEWMAWPALLILINCPICKVWYNFSAESQYFSNLQNQIHKNLMAFNDLIYDISNGLEIIGEKNI